MRALAHDKQYATQLLHDFSQCGICLDTLNEPCTLDCGHTFCRACIDAQVATELRSRPSSTSFVCAECRHPAHVGALRPTNVKMKSLVGEAAALAHHVHLTHDLIFQLAEHVRRQRSAPTLPGAAAGNVLSASDMSILQHLVQELRHERARASGASSVCAKRRRLG